MAVKTVERKVCDITGQDIPAGFDLTIKIEGAGSAAEFSHTFNDVGPKAAKALRSKIVALIKAATAGQVVGNPAPVEGCADYLVYDKVRSDPQTTGTDAQ